MRVHILSERMRKSAGSVLGVLAALVLHVLFVAGGVRETYARNDAPGLFDYYVLSMSWSPTFCMRQASRGRLRRNDPQCRAGAGYGFVLHGLWPQFRRGWPSECRTKNRFVPDAVIRAVMDVMPAKGLVIHEWRKHGTCSGLSPRAYFNLAERLFRQVTVPQDYRAPRRPLKRTPQQIRRAFYNANRDHGFFAESFTVVCDRQDGQALLKEIRVCFTPTGRPSRCGMNESRSACRARIVLIPPVR